VNPRFSDALQHEEAVAFASGANDVLEQAEIVGSVEEALKGCNHVAAVTARLREFSPPVQAPRGWAESLAVSSDVTAALLFGNERFGLPNELVEHCNTLINIPANSDYASLNLAQAIQVLAYEARMASSEDAVPPSAIGFQGELAEMTQIERMYDHIEQALVAIEFLDPSNPKKLMPRLRRLFSRTGLETEEVNILRGMAGQIMKKCRRD
jgi:tRNA/rRNA methyltransferase